MQTGNDIVTTSKVSLSTDAERDSRDASVAKMKHQPALDGLRGAAVAAVLLFHAGHLTGGYLGVDAFFVLSGYLITSLLLAEARREGSIALGAFWGRRARRLMPALVGVLAAVAVYAAFIARPEELATIRGDALATMAYVANWRQVLTSTDYFALFRSPSPLQHTWSLSIEEQFYLLWPLVVFGLTRRRDPVHAARVVLRTSLALAVVSFVVAQVLYAPGTENRVYYGTDTRAMSLLVGTALAAWLVLRGPARSARGQGILRWGAVACVGGLAAAWVWLSGGSVWLYRGGLLFSAVTTAVVILAAVHPEGGLVRRWLSWRPLCALGLISYGVYLWHWPLYVVLDEQRVHLGGWPLVLVRVTATLVVACASYFWIERPIRRGVGAPRLWLVVAPVTTALLVVAILVSTTGAPSARAIAAGPKRGGIMVVGNSVARSLVPGLQAAGLGATNRSVVGCSILGGRVEVWDGREAVTCGPFRAWSADLRPRFALLVTGMYEMFNIRLATGSPLLVPGTSAFAGHYTAALQAAIDDLASKGATVVVPNVPCMHANFLPASQREQAAVDPGRLRIENQLIRQVVTRPRNRGRVISPDLRALLCPDGKFHKSFGNIADVRPDGEHFSDEGAVAVAKWLRHTVPGLASVTRTRASTVDRLAERLRRVGGYFCVFGAPDAKQPGLEGAVSCKDQNETGQLRVYSDSGALARFTTLYRTVACTYARQANTTAIHYLAADRWILLGQLASAPELPALLGGNPVTVPC